VCCVRGVLRISTRSREVTAMGKGSRREREFVELCHDAGLPEVYRPATVRFGENDMYGLFDVQMLSQSAVTVGVQVKSNGARGINDWQEQTQVFREAGWVTVYACPYDNQGWRVVDVRDDERTDVVDERPVTGVEIGSNVVEYLREL